MSPDDAAPGLEVPPAGSVPPPGPAGDEPPLVIAASPALPSSGPEAVTFVAVLRRRDFRILWAAQVCSQLADKFLVYTLLIVLFALTGRSSTQSLVLLAYTLPSVLLSAPAGVYADRHDKRALMLGTNLVRGLLVLLIPICLSTPGLSGQPWPLLVITLLFSGVGQVFAPAEAASIPFVVARDQIMIATSLFMTTVVGTLVAGVPLASVTIKLAGSRAAFYIAASLFLVATVLVWRVGTSLRASARAHAPQQNVIRELREGMGILAADAALRVGLVQLTVALVVVFTIFALGPAYMARVLGRAPEDTFLLLLPATVGLVGSALALGRWQHGRTRGATLALAAVVGGAMLVTIGTVPGRLAHWADQRPLVTLMLALGTGLGAALGALLVISFTVMQERTDEASRGRVFGGIFTVINAATALPLLLAGGLADGFGVDRVTAGLGVLLIVHGAAARLLYWPQLGALDRRPGEVTT